MLVLWGARKGDIQVGGINYLSLAEMDRILKVSARLLGQFEDTWKDIQEVIEKANDAILKAFLEAPGVVEEIAAQNAHPGLPWPHFDSRCERCARALAELLDGFKARTDPERAESPGSRPASPPQRAGSAGV